MFKAKLEVGGQEYNVLKASYELFQETDATGRPSSVTRGGKIKFRVEATKDTSLSDWMYNNFERRDGSIKFLKRDNEATDKELSFTEGYAVRFLESFDHEGEIPMHIDMVISAKKIKVGNGEHVNPWPENA